MVQPNLLRFLDLENTGGLGDAIAYRREQSGFAAGRSSNDQDAQAFANRLDQGLDDRLRGKVPGNELGGQNRFWLKQADGDGRIAFPRSDYRMADLDARAAWQAFLPREFGIHRRRCFVTGPPQGREQSLDSSPDVVLGGMDVNGHEILFSLRDDPDGSVRVDGDLGQVAVQAQQRGKETQAAHAGNRLTGDGIDIPFRDLKAQARCCRQDSLDSPRDELFSILAQLLEGMSLERFGNFVDDLCPLLKINLG